MVLKNDWNESDTVTHDDMNDIANEINRFVGTPGPPGNNGWSPLFAVITDGERNVLRLQDWTGGSGAKPTAGLYIGQTGLVSNITQAKDIRGSKGLNGDAGFSPEITLAEQSPTTYILRITTAYGSFLTPNLQGQDGVGTGGGGEGNMLKEVYDPQGKATDIFAYVGDYVENYIGPLNNALQARLDGVI